MNLEYCFSSLIEKLDYRLYYVALGVSGRVCAQAVCRRVQTYWVPLLALSLHLPRSVPCKWGCADSESALVLISSPKGKGRSRGALLTPTRVDVLSDFPEFRWMRIAIRTTCSYCVSRWLCSWVNWLLLLVAPEQRSGLCLRHQHD